MSEEQEIFIRDNMPGATSLERSGFFLGWAAALKSNELKQMCLSYDEEYSTFPESESEGKEVYEHIMECLARREG